MNGGFIINTHNNSLFYNIDKVIKESYQLLKLIRDPPGVRKFAPKIAQPEGPRFWANFRTKGGSLPNQMRDFMWVVQFQIVLGAGT